MSDLVPDAIVPNTLQLDSRAVSVELVSSVTQLQRLCRSTDPRQLLILGEGSNVVLAPRLERRVCLMRNRGIETRNSGKHVQVTVAAGENWHALVRWSLAAGLCGLENLALIPGSVGAAPVQNIGAYGVEFASCCAQVETVAIDTGEVRAFSAAECGFGYRHSVFSTAPGRFAITAVTLALSREPDLHVGYPDVQDELSRMGRSRIRAVDVAEAVIRVRRRKLPDPRTEANAGSFFKNPIVSSKVWQALQNNHPQLVVFEFEDRFKLSAAQLIDLAGWKLRRSGLLTVWQRQPLVIVNGGETNGVAVLHFAGEIQTDIEERFGVRLEIEPDLIGF